MIGMRSQPRKTKRRSELQAHRRNAFIKCVEAWKVTISQGKTKLWAVYADRHTVKNKKGKIVTLLAWNWFLKINIYRIYNGLDPIYDPPDD